MSAVVTLRPGTTPLIHWREIYRGAAVELDPFARPDVDAGGAALADYLARESSPPLPETDGPSLAELMEAGGDRLPSPLVRLFVALKLTSLAQGFSGVRWETLRGTSDFLAAGLLPAVPAEATSDRRALAFLFAALTGTGEIVGGDKRLPAAKALKEAGLSPLKLEPQERSALLSGTALSTAAALAGLFEAERVFRSALVASALSAAAMRCPATPLHPRALELHGQPGAVEVEESLRALSGPPEANGDASGTEERATSGAPFRLGACLDLLRQAGATSELAANAVTEDRLIVWQSGEMIAGIEDRSAIETASNLIALALTKIGEDSHRRIAALGGPADEVADADAAVQASPAERAGGFVARIRELADERSNGRTLMAMSGMAALVLAIEFLEAARLSPDEGEHHLSALGEVQRLLREAAPRSDTAGLSPAADLAAIAERVGSGALVAAAGVSLPGVVRRPPARR